MGMEKSIEEKVLLTLPIVEKESMLWGMGGVPAIPEVKEEYL